MKQGSNQRRSRGRGNNNSGGGSGGGGGNRRGGRNQNYESNGPDVKVRGSAQQVLDKYLQLARDSQSGGDRVKAEGYLQFAEHYYRVASAQAEQQGERMRERQQADAAAESATQKRVEAPSTEPVSAPAPVAEEGTLSEGENAQTVDDVAAEAAPKRPRRRSGPRSRSAEPKKDEGETPAAETETISA